MCERGRAFTLVEIVVLVFIATFVLAVAVPKFISATNLRRAKEVTVILNRLFEAEYSYHHKHETFTAQIEKLPVRESELSSKWFRYDIPYAGRDSFLVRAVVRRPFGRASTNDWAAISSSRMRSISNPQTLGKYAVEWMAMIHKDDKKWYRRHFEGDIEYEPD
jgi:type II secretory pathway pseudopilin PulG